MTTAPKTQRHRASGIRRAAAAAAVIGIALTGVAAVGVPAFAAEARPAAAAAANPAPVAETDATAPVAIEPVSIEPLSPAAPSERGVPGVGLSIFFGTALTVGAGGIVTARLLAHKQHRVAEARVRG